MFRIRVMTFNIRGATYEDGVNAWRNRAELNARTIKQHAPDLIGFQEMQVGNLETYRQLLPEYGRVMGSRYNRPGRLFYNSVFWNPTRLSLMSSGGFYLSRTPGTWSSDWGAARVHAVTWARFRFADTGERFLVLNTHLDHKSHKARLKSSELIMHKAASLRADGLPIIIAGDFNSPPQFSDPSLKTPHHIFSKGGFLDTHLAVGNEDNKSVNTYHGFKGDQFPVDDYRVILRIDWILTRNGRLPIRPKGHKIVRDAELPLCPSDHYPVVADLVVG
jgi:endonuclease/exonuclease/phosphatase family metal-dependent hydrolase